MNQYKPIKNVYPCVQGRGAITRTDIMIVLASIADLVGVHSLEKCEEVLDRILPRLGRQDAVFSTVCHMSSV